MPPTAYLVRGAGRRPRRDLVYTLVLALPALQGSCATSVSTPPPPAAVSVAPAEAPAAPAAAASPPSPARASAAAAAPGAKGVPPPLEPIDAEMSTSDREAGVVHLQIVMRRLQSAINAKEFAEAERLVASAQNGVEHASSLTRAHPDFDDVADAVAQAPHQLQDAVARDAAQRRRDAIALLRKKGDDLNEMNPGIIEALRGEVPSAAVFADAQDALRAYADLNASAATYLDDPAFAQASHTRDEAAARLTTALAAAQRQLEMVASLEPLLQSGAVAARGAKASPAPRSQAESFRQAAASFGRCATLLQAQTRDPDMHLHTTLGSFTCASLAQRCAATARQMQSAANEADWRADVMDVVHTMFKAPPSPAPTTKGPAPEKKTPPPLAVIAPEACPRLRHLQDVPAANREALFPTPWGFYPLPTVCAICEGQPPPPPPKGNKARGRPTP